jgi:hypothetical protein
VRKLVSWGDFLLAAATGDYEAMWRLVRNAQEHSVGDGCLPACATKHLKGVVDVDTPVPLSREDISM